MWPQTWGHQSRHRPEDAGRGRKGPPPGAAEGLRACSHLRFGVLAAGTGGEYISVVCAVGYGSPRTLPPQDGCLISTCPCRQRCHPRHPCPCGASPRGEPANDDTGLSHSGCPRAALRHLFCCSEVRGWVRVAHTERVAARLRGCANCWQSWMLKFPTGIPVPPSACYDLCLRDALGILIKWFLQATFLSSSRNSTELS